MSKFLFFPFSLIFCVLAGCGGSSNNGPVDPVVDQKEQYNISGNASGLSGAVDLVWLNQHQAINGDGEFTFSDAVTQGQNVTLSLNNIPESQECTISGETSFNNVSRAISGVSIICVNKTALQIQVTDYFTGENVSAVRVNAVWMEGDETKTQSTVADASGNALLYFSAMDSRVSISVSGTGYGTQSRTIILAAGDTAITQSISLQPANAVLNFNASTGGELAVEQLPIVTVPASAFVDASGAAYSGDIQAEITLIDASRDPALMPGGYQTLNSLGEVAYIESFGAIDVSFFDNEGNELQLGEGQQATIRIPLSGDPSRAPATVPLYYFDETSGYWVKEGEASLVTVNEELVYQGMVSHFSVWNADMEYETVFIQGCVENAAGERVMASIQTRGLDYIGTAEATSNSLGEFSVAARQNSNLLVSAINGLQSRTLTLTVADINTNLDNCLVVDKASSTITLSWGEAPEDLDSHFFGPTDAAKTDQFHVYFDIESALSGSSYMYLDVDDVSSFGPEIVSISDFSVAGTYRYAVHHYEGEGDIASSPARVELNLNGEITVFSPPSGDATLCWAVFDIDVTESGEATLVPINTWEAEAYCDGDFGDDPIVTTPTIIEKSNIGMTKPRTSVLTSVMNRKYYSN